MIVQDGHAQYVGISDSIVAQIAVALKATVCAQGETMWTEATLRVLTRGLCGMSGRILRAGDVWGEDFILEYEPLRQKRMATALTFAEDFILEYEPLRQKRMATAL